MKKGLIFIGVWLILGTAIFVYYNYIQENPTGIYTGKVEKLGNCGRTFINIDLDSNPASTFEISGVNNNYNKDLRDFCKVIQKNDSITIDFESQEIVVTRNEKLFVWELNELSSIRKNQ